MNPMRLDNSTASQDMWLSIAAVDIDPLTGLVAFPAFERLLQEHIMLAPSVDQGLCLAIGDVDDLKVFVEGVNGADPAWFGHLAGNRVMAKLGLVTRAVAAERLANARWWCAATFGGDEIILLAGAERELFQQVVVELRDRLAAELPTSVSFAYGCYPHPGPLASKPAHTAGLRMLASIDRALFSLKRAARAAGGVPRGELFELTAMT